MKADVAIAICEEWFAYLERRKQKSLEMQKLASMARKGPQEQKEAQRRMKQLDLTSLTVYDGGRLEPAVRALVKLARAQATVTERHK